MNLIYESGDFFVTAETFGRTNGYAVYQNGHTAAVRCARIGYPASEGLKRAIAECDRRSNECKALRAEAR
jgi:hypothetical protein